MINKNTLKTGPDPGSQTKYTVRLSLCSILSGDETLQKPQHTHPEHARRRQQTEMIV